MTEYLKRKQAAKLFGVCLRTIDYWVATGEIPHTRIGKRMVRFDRRRLEEWFRQRETYRTAENE
jgi:excisionase family DNA binding protein